MRLFVPLALIMLCGCSSVRIPESFTYQEIQTSSFKIASWNKIQNDNAPFKIYIEGDGNAFNAYGYPTSDPTPRGKFLRELAFSDKNANVAYIARPCQFVKDEKCRQLHWTTGRFSKETVAAIAEAIKKIAGNSPATLVGFSGGAQIAGLTASLYNDLNIKKIITISGNLDHPAWTAYHKIAPLKDSLDLNEYKAAFDKFDSTHYAGEKDKIIPPMLIKGFAGESRTIIVPGATHASYPETIKEEIRKMI